MHELTDFIELPFGIVNKVPLIGCLPITLLAVTHHTDWNDPTVSPDDVSGRLLRDQRVQVVEVKVNEQDLNCPAVEFHAVNHLLGAIIDYNQ